MSADEGSIVAQLSDGEVSASEVEQPLSGLRHREGGELGRGGMARVVSGFDPVLERGVALKRSLHGTPSENARLLREAKLTARLDHPSIAAVLDVGLDASGALVCVLPVREGRSLLEAVREEPSAPAPPLLRALLSASQALAHAHARGVVHRDISPQNVRLGADGAVWLLDWGLAATRDDARAGGFRGGTPGCTSPELREGLPAGPQSDVWSLGALLHLICARALPVEGKPGRRPRTCPRALWAVCLRALADAPDARYPDARAFAAELTRWLDGQPVEALREGPLDALVRITARRPRLTLAVISVTAALLVASLLVLRASEKESAATARLLRDSAERALAMDDVAMASQLARESLALQDDARTRGILAALARTPEIHEEALADAPCAPGFIDEAGVLCERDGMARLRDDTVLHLTRDERRQNTFWAGSGAPLVLSGGQPNAVVDLTHTHAVLSLPDDVVMATLGGAFKRISPCTPKQPIRFALPLRDGALVFCADDEIVITSATEVLRRMRSPALGTVFRGTESGDLLDEHRLLMGTASGQVGVLDLDTLALQWAAPTALGMLHTIVASADGRAAVLVGEQGASLLRVREGQLLPLETPPEGVWRRGAHDFTVSRGVKLSKLVPPEGLSVTRGLHGRGTLTVHEGTRRVAVGDGFGGVQVLHLDRGVEDELETGPRVVKGLSFSSDGRFLAVGAGGPDGLTMYDVSRVPAVRLETPESAASPVRHLSFIDERCAVLFNWGVTGRVVCFDGERFVEAFTSPDAPFNVTSVARQPGGGLLTAEDGQLWRFRFDEALTFTPEPGLAGRLIALSPDGQRRVMESDRDVLSVAVADDGRLARCRRDGVVELRSVDGEVLFEAPAHDQRCAHVVFCDDQRALCSAGWDGRLRVLQAVAAR